MKIESIKLENYRQYRDLIIKFPTSSQNNVIIIQGANGAGKTNILNAITWCFYGKEKHLDAKYKGYPLMNTITLRELEPGIKSNVGVMVQMRDEENKKIMIGRSYRFRKSGEGKIVSVGDSPSSSAKGSKLQMIMQLGKDMVKVPDPEYTLNRMIPEDIEEYFFFDGEKLNEYFKDTSGEKICEAVFKISQLGLLENAIIHLENKRADFVRKTQDLGTKADEIDKDLQQEMVELKKLEDEFEKFKIQKEQARKKEEEFSEKLRTCSATQIREIETERLEIDTELKRIDIQTQELKKEQLDFLIEKAPGIFAYDSLVKTRDLIGQGQEAGDIPPDYKPAFLQKLLENERCICSTELPSGSHCRKEIEKLLSDCSAIGGISGELTKEYARLKIIIDSISEFNDKRIKYGKKIQELNAVRDTKSEKLKKISDKISGSDIEQIKKWGNKLQDYRQLKDDLIEQISDRKFYIKEKTKKITKLKKEFDYELRKQERHKELRRILSFCDVNLTLLKEVKEEIMEDVRKEIEERTQDQFLSMLWKKETYTKVKIDPNYQITVLDQHGWEATGTLSAGERQALALSFIAALNSVSGFNVPIIIDTPLSRMSSEPKEKIASKLASYFEGKQITLLVTDEEYTDQVRKALSKNTCGEYVIDFTESAQGCEAKVVPYEK